MTLPLPILKLLEIFRDYFYVYLLEEYVFLTFWSENFVDDVIKSWVELFRTIICDKELILVRIKIGDDSGRNHLSNAFNILT